MRRALMTSSLAPALALSMMAVVGPPAQAQESLIVVDTTSDVSDFGGAQQVGDLPGPDGLVSFREAITAANNTVGTNTIVFNIPLENAELIGDSLRMELTGSPPWRLTDDGTTIDGASQVAFNGRSLFFMTTPPFANLKGITVDSDNNVLTGLPGFLQFRYGIELNGDNNAVTGSWISQTISAGIHVTGAGNTIGGTATGAGNRIVNSGGNGIWIRFPSAIGNVVQGNVLTSHHSNGVDIELDASGNLIGGTTPEARNVISGNGHFSGERNPVGANVSVAGSDNVVQGNYIGVDATGTKAGGNAVRDGVRVSGTGNLIGGTRSGAGNVISGHDYNSQQLSGRPAGLRVDGSGHIIQGNLIGTDASGTKPIPNQHGLQVTDSTFDGAPTNILIGGSEQGAANVIAHNVLSGLTVLGLGEPPTGVTISRNSIFDNAGLGIDLGADGVTPNDAGDADAGVNNLQNFPVITSVTEQDGSTSVTGTIDTPAPQTVTIELFSSQQADPSGFGEGRTFQATATPDAAGNFTAVLPGGLAGQFVTGTATDAVGNTSEFSRAQLVGNEPPVAVASATPQQGIAPLEVSFSSANSHDADGTIVSRQWDFGDGTTSSEANPTHTYTDPGTYTATLTVVDNEGSAGTDTVIVTVDPDPATVLRVSDIDLQTNQRRGVVTATGNVTVLDGNGAGVKDVTVHATWTLPDGTTLDQTATTKGSGSAGFHVEDGAGTYTLTITDVTKTGHTFDADNSVLEASVTH